jgi:hypothetical protein
MGLSTGHDGKSSDTFQCRGGGMMKEAAFLVKLCRHEKTVHSQSLSKPVEFGCPPGAGSDPVALK